MNTERTRSSATSDPDREVPIERGAAADQLDQRREDWVDAPDPERTSTEPNADGVEADPADVMEQSIEVPEDDGRDRPAE